MGPLALSPSLGVQIVAPDTLGAGHDARLGLRLTSERGEWAHGPPHGVGRATVRWTDLASGRAITETVPLTLPLVVGARETVVVPLRVQVPSAPGRYTLDVRVASRDGTVDRAAAPRTLEVRGGLRLLTSAEAADRLAAQYAVVNGAA